MLVGSTPHKAKGIFSLIALTGNEINPSMKFFFIIAAARSGVFFLDHFTLNPSKGVGDRIMDRNTLLIALALICSLLPMFAMVDEIDYSILNAQELGQISEMLQSQNLELEHLKFYRDWDPSTRFKSAWHLSILQDAPESLDKLSALRELLGAEDLRRKLIHLGQICWDSPDLVYDVQTDPSLDVSAMAQKIKKPKDIFTATEQVWDIAQRYLQAAFIDLTLAQQDSLCAFLIQAMIESEDSEQYQAYFTQLGLPWLEDIQMDQITPMLSKVRFDHLLTAGLICHDWALELKGLKLSFTNKKPILHHSKYGLMVIGSTGSDIYRASTIKALKDKPLCLVIDPAGNDIYEVSISTSRHNPFYLIIDHSGDDVYRSGAGKHPSMFSLSGIGISCDLSGNDLYDLGDFSFSSIMGISLHQDLGGDDTYKGGLFAQGAAAAGIAILQDQAGNDSYSAYCMSQAFGSTLGAGVLCDNAGADTYYLGGKYFHAPLMPNDYRTMGQGMGFGMRPDYAGGLGLLYDKSGNDKYIGGVYAQGVGYWYATGILIDESGNDVYNAIYYPHGSGIHLASGILYDGAGDDTYYSRNGPGQGAGHDWAFGMLVDAGGNDAYSIHGGNGLGLSNSLGIFLDKSGNDRYERKEVQNYGSANLSRGTGGIGIFLDTGGSDAYPDSLMRDNHIWQKGTYGFGRDLELIEQTETAPAETAASPDDPAPADDEAIDKIFAAASEWEVGSAINRVKAARQILLSRASEAIPYILEHKLNGKSGLEYRALEFMAKSSPDFLSQLFNYVNDPDSLKAKTSISLLATMEQQELLPYLQSHLEAQRYIPACISALGYFKNPESVALLTSLKHQPNERLRFLVARALLQIDNEEAKAALEGFAEDRSYLIQSMLRNIPKDGK